MAAGEPDAPIEQVTARESPTLDVPVATTYKEASTDGLAQSARQPVAAVQEPEDWHEMGVGNPLKPALHDTVKISPTFEVVPAPRT